MGNKVDIFKTFEKITEIAGWIRIVISFILLGVLLGLVIHYFIDNSIGLIVSIIVVIFVILFGIAAANKAWKGKGTVHLLSRVIASPELDDEEKLKTN